MSALWQGEELLQPISADQPCGQNLEDTQLLASFDAFRLFGRTKPLEAPADAAREGPETVEDRDERPPEWGEVKQQSLEALRQSKDLRLLVHLGTALLRTDGLPAFVETVKIASRWLAENWDQTFPLVDGDGIVRRSALNCFADPIAVVDALRRVPIISSREHGSFSLRDIDLASGQLAVGKDESRPEDAQINAAFAATALEDLSQLQQGVGDALTSLNSIDAQMRSELGTEAVPTFEPLVAQLAKINRVLRTQLATRTGAVVEGADAEAAGATAGSAAFSGAVKSRDDAVRALEAVADFFRKHEPSSPIPMLCDRAKRLVSRGFLEVLADIAPDAVGQARAAGGLREAE